jgi:DNA-binding response OmpR family regulator
MTAPLVLLAEDDEDVRALAEFVLRREGYEVAAVSDGREALDAAGDAQLDKPFSPAVLAERVRALLEGRAT